MPTIQVSYNESIIRIILADTDERFTAEYDYYIYSSNTLRRVHKITNVVETGGNTEFQPITDSNNAAFLEDTTRTPKIKIVRIEKLTNGKYDFGYELICDQYINVNSCLTLEQSINFNEHLYDHYADDKWIYRVKKGDSPFTINYEDDLEGVQFFDNQWKKCTHPITNDIHKIVAIETTRADEMSEIVKLKWSGLFTYVANPNIKTIGCLVQGTVVCNLESDQSKCKYYISASKQLYRINNASGEVQVLTRSNWSIVIVDAIKDELVQQVKINGYRKLEDRSPYISTYAIFVEVINPDKTHITIDACIERTNKDKLFVSKRFCKNVLDAFGHTNYNYRISARCNQLYRINKETNRTTRLDVYVTTHARNAWMEVDRFLFKIEDTVAVKIIDVECVSLPNDMSDFKLYNIYYELIGTELKSIQQIKELIVQHCRDLNVNHDNFNTKINELSGMIKALNKLEDTQIGK